MDKDYGYIRIGDSYHKLTKGITYKATNALLGTGAVYLPSSYTIEAVYDTLHAHPPTQGFFNGHYITLSNPKVSQGKLSCSIIPIGNDWLDLSQDIKSLPVSGATVSNFTGSGSDFIGYDMPAMARQIRELYNGRRSTVSPSWIGMSYARSKSDGFGNTMTYIIPSTRMTSTNTSTLWDNLPDWSIGDFLAIFCILHGVRVSFDALGDMVFSSLSVDASSAVLGEAVGVERVTQPSGYYWSTYSGGTEIPWSIAAGGTGDPEELSSQEITLVYAAGQSFDTAAIGAGTSRGTDYPKFAARLTTYAPTWSDSIRSTLLYTLKLKRAYRPGDPLMAYDGETSYVLTEVKGTEAKGYRYVSIETLSQAITL